MKKLILVFTVSLFLPLVVWSQYPVTLSSDAACKNSYMNPVFEPDLADPTIIKADDGYFYAYGTENTWSPGVHRVVPVVRSKDMFFSADWKYNPGNEAENFRIGVAVSDRPTGPFKDISGKPVFDPGYPVIDANLLTYKGKNYLYYSRCCYKNPVETEISSWARKLNLFQTIEESWIYGVEISADFTHVIGQPVLLLRPPVSLTDKQSEWESRSVTAGEINRRWTEGPFSLVYNNTVYLMGKQYCATQMVVPDSGTNSD